MAQLTYKNFCYIDTICLKCGKPCKKGSYQFIPTMNGYLCKWCMPNPVRKTN